MKKYSVYGMSCAACSSRVEKAVSKVDGVDSVAVNLLTNSMIVEGDVNPKVIMKAVEDAGYKAKLQENEKTKSENTKQIYMVINISCSTYVRFDGGHNVGIPGSGCI